MTAAEWNMEKVVFNFWILWVLPFKLCLKLHSKVESWDQQCWGDLSAKVYVEILLSIKQAPVWDLTLGFLHWGSSTSQGWSQVKGHNKKFESMG